MVPSGGAFRQASIWPSGHTSATSCVQGWPLAVVGAVDGSAFEVGVEGAVLLPPHAASAHTMSIEMFFMGGTLARPMGCAQALNVMPS